MIKILEINYSPGELEEYINKTKYSFLGFVGDKMIFKYTEKTSRQLKAKTKTEKFFDMAISREFNKELLMECLPETNLTEIDVKNALASFCNYRLEKNDNSVKRKWQKEKTFEITSRLRTRFNNTKPNINGSKEAIITNEI